MSTGKTNSPNISVNPTTGRAFIDSELTHFGQTERLLSGEPYYDLLIKEDGIRRRSGIPPIFDER